MTKRVCAALVAEAVLVVAVVGLVAGMAGEWLSPAAVSVAAGAGAMLALGVPSLLIVMWGRERSQQVFMLSVVGVLLGKFALVGMGVVYIWMRTDLARLEFVFGLMAGWILSFLAQTALLRGSVKPSSSGGRPEARHGSKA